MKIDTKNTRLIEPVEPIKRNNSAQNIENQTNLSINLSEIAQEVCKMEDDYRFDLIPKLVLTHPHADAISGLDTYLMMGVGKIPLYCDKSTFSTS